MIEQTTKWNKTRSGKKQCLLQITRASCTIFNIELGYKTRIIIHEFLTRISVWFKTCQEMLWLARLERRKAFWNISLGQDSKKTSKIPKDIWHHDGRIDWDLWNYQIRCQSESLAKYLLILADVNSILFSLKSNEIEGERFDGVNDLVHWFCEKIPRQKEQPILRKVETFLSIDEIIENSGLRKDLAFSIMKEETHHNVTHSWKQTIWTREQRKTALHAENRLSKAMELLRITKRSMKSSNFLAVLERYLLDCTEYQRFKKMTYLWGQKNHSQAVHTIAWTSDWQSSVTMFRKISEKSTLSSWKMMKSQRMFKAFTRSRLWMKQLTFQLGHFSKQEATHEKMKKMARLAVTNGWWPSLVHKRRGHHGHSNVIILAKLRMKKRWLEWPQCQGTFQMKTLVERAHWWCFSYNAWNADTG